MKKDIKINIIGSYFGQDGYSNHTRQLACALNNLKDVEVTMTCNKPQDWVRWVNDDELKMMQRNPEDCDINLMIAQPVHWKSYLCEDKPFVGFCVWEGDRIPVSWIEILLDERVSQLWVPSKHTKEAILNTELDTTDIIGVPNWEYHKKKILDKLFVVPHGVDTNIFHRLQVKKSSFKEQLDEGIRSPPESRFKFLANKGYRNTKDRGGYQFLWKAFHEEFSKDEPVELICKINGAYGIPDLKNEFKKLGIKDNSNIKFVTENLDYKQLNEFYNLGDVFVTTSQAEAFNLPCLEAQACGLPVIATDFAGHTDFVNDNNGWILKEGTMKEVKHEIEYEGISWKEPNIKEIRKVLRYVYEHKDEVKEKGKIALDDSKDWQWKDSALKAQEFLKNL